MNDILKGMVQSDANWEYTKETKHVHLKKRFAISIERKTSFCLRFTADSKDFLVVCTRNPEMIKC